MSFSASLSPGWIGLLALGLYGGFLIWALWAVPWRILLREPGLQHLFLGGTLVVGFIWQLQAAISYSVSIHVLLATTLTLMFYWPMALIATSIALLALTLAGKASWDMFGINALITCLLPVLISHGLWRWVERALPANYFIFVLIAGCGGAAAAALGSGLSVILFAALLTSSVEFSFLSRDYFLFLPLTLPPEAIINGVIITSMTAFLPDWVRAFDPQKYLDQA